MVLGGCILVVIAVFLPPLAVLIRRGCGAEFLICIGLLFLGWIPGVLYAWFIIAESPTMRQRARMRKERREEFGYGRGPEQEVGYVVRRRSSSQSRFERSRRPQYRDEFYDSGREQIAYYPPPPRSRSKY